MIRALIFLFLSVGFATPLFAQDRVLFDKKNGIVHTSRNSFRVVTSSDGFTKCVRSHRRENSDLYCVVQDHMYFGNPIALKDFTVIPIFSDCGGSACGYPSTTLLIESGEDVFFHVGLMQYCLPCGKIVRIDPSRNEIDFLLDRSGGKTEYMAKFINGKVVVLNVALERTEPLKKAECDWLYNEVLDICLRPTASTCKSLLFEQNIGGMVTLRGIAGLENRYRGFSGERVSQLCDQACSNRKKPSRAAFNKEICRR